MSRGTNCGLDALEKLTPLKNVSMFTLIHLAKDNGTTLYFCKVEQEELLSVARPAIFHQKDHFVYVKNGEPMPTGEYDGYVLTPRPMHEPLPYTFAKKIRGGKKFRDVIGPIFTGLLGMVNPMLGAAAGAIFGGVQAKQSGGNWLTGALTGGIGGYAGGKFLGGAAQGFRAGGTTMMGKLGGALSGGASALAGGSPVRSAAGTTPGGYSGSVMMPGVGTMSSSAAQNLATGGARISALPGTSSGGVNLGGMVGGPAGLAGAAASALLPPPKMEGDIYGNYTKSARFLGGENYNRLPNVTRDQLEKYTNTSLQDLSKEFYAPDDKGARLLDERKQQEIDALMLDYANRGQDPYSSTDAQRRLTEVNRQYDQARAEYEQQLQNQSMEKAIQFKKDMLRNSMEQGQFDYNAAMELATYAGRDQELKYAIESKNHEMLQNVLAELFSVGINTARR